MPWLGAATCKGILSLNGTKTTNKPEVVLVGRLQHPLSKSVRSRHKHWVHQGAHGETNRVESQPWTGSSSQWGKFFGQRTLIKTEFRSVSIHPLQVECDSRYAMGGMMSPDRWSHCLSRAKWLVRAISVQLGTTTCHPDHPLG